MSHEPGVHPGDVPVAGLLRTDDLQHLVDALISAGYDVIGPTIDQCAVIYDQITSVSQLPRGWSDSQEPGRYRLHHGDHSKYFGFAVGPHSWKKYLFPPQSIVSTATRCENGWQLSTDVPAPPRLAFLGVRACELAAIEIQDRVFLHGPWIDPIYKARREAAFIIAVNCTSAASTCFCSSTNTGPKCRAGFDLALTEIASGFVIETGSESGRAIAAALPLEPVAEQHRAEAAAATAQAEAMMTRELKTDDLHDLLLGNLKHPHWEDVAKRCLSCTNCTMVCPTCFCSTVTEVSDLTGDHVERERKWDSCFNIDFSYMNGTPVRNSIASRYRQWLTHKLASWQDQFGTLGCVGCGRCITWCPPGIDLTEEVAKLRDSVQQDSLHATAENPS
ncbi:MAG: 4Fe-4S dicluster domain-containing protein [Planctomycetaceae bacterium]